MTSPLRYPGGKTKGIKAILPYIPTDIKRLASPFFGGGSLELHLAGRGIKVFGYDNYEPLVNFWRQLLRHPAELAAEVESCFYPMNKLTFHNIRRYVNSPCMLPITRAAIFYALNRSSYSGLTQNGGFSRLAAKDRMKLNHVRSLAAFKQRKLKVSLEDFPKTIWQHRRDFLYCDPPYYIDACLYGDKGQNNLTFRHKKLARCLKTKAERWLLSYNDCDFIRDLYHGHRIEVLNWNYSITNQSVSGSEILIFSKN